MGEVSLTRHHVQPGQVQEVQKRLAAGIPLLLAVSAVVATFGLIGPISQIVPVEESIKHVVLLIGLAVGVDYSLFYVRRMKEELQQDETRTRRWKPRPRPQGTRCSCRA